VKVDKSFLFKGIKKRLMFFIFLILLLTAFIFSFYSLQNLRENMYQQKQLQTQEMVESGLGVLREFHQQEQEGELTTEEAQNQALNVIQNMTFGPENQDYFWIINEELVMKMHPYASDLVGENVADLQDRKGNYLIREMKEITDQKGAGFVEYHWEYYDREDKIEPKLSYVKECTPWGWVLGSGVYVNDIEAAYLDLRNRFIMIGWGILLLGLFLTYILSSYFTRPIILVTKALQKLTDYNLNFSHKASLKKYITRQDEIGEMIGSLFKMKENLKETRKKLQITQFSVDKAALMVFRINSRGQFTYVNDTACSKLGYTKEQLLEMKVSDIELNTEQQERKISWENLKKEREITKEKKYQTKAGHVFPVLLTREYLKYRDQEYEVAFVRDITERKEAKQSLQKSRKNLAATLNSIGDAVISTDKEGYITRMNSVAERLTGWPEKEAKGKELTTVFEIINSRTGEPVANPVQKVIQSGKKVGLANHTLLKSRDGNEYQIADSAAPIRVNGGSVIGVVLVFRDVTDEYRMKEKIKSQNKRLKSIIEGTNVGTWEWNVQTGANIINDKWAEIIGYTKEELSPVTFETWKSLTHPQDLKKCEEMLEKHFQGQIEQYNLELRMKHKQGHWVWILDRGKVISRTEEGEPLWMFGTHLDITQRKKREEEIRYMTYHDNMTDLYNRTFMEKEIENLNKGTNLPLSFIMTDINGLKLINEAYGHQKGDEVLRKTADLLSSCARKKDTVARWAGDEFIIILPRTKDKTARQICRSIRDKCRGTYEDDIPLSLGIGYATRTDMEEDIYDILHKAENNVNKDKLTKTKSTKNKLVQNMLETLGAKSYETKEHARRMTNFALKLGEEIGLTEERLNHLSLLATLHDIGKVNISEAILKKPSRLTDSEWEKVKEHTEKGYAIASSIEEFSPVAESILAHHERWDGQGYPRGLSGEEIPLLARIISIVDAYDVMIYGRPYKKPMEKEAALQELKRCAGSQFDPELVAKFVDII
ncbi:MAG: PAS domain S-box protein, partial [Bacillota bacterium]